MSQIFKSIDDIGQHWSKDHMERVLEMADRREAYCKNAVPCPKCDTKQVQIVLSEESHAEWKCRECSHRWKTFLTRKVAIDEKLL